MLGDFGLWTCTHECREIQCGFRMSRPTVSGRCLSGAVQDDGWGTRRYSTDVVGAVASGDERIQHLATTLCLHRKLVPETMKRRHGKELGRLTVRPLAITTGILHCAKRFAVLRGLSKGSPLLFEMSGRVNGFPNSVSGVASLRLRFVATWQVAGAFGLLANWANVGDIRLVPGTLKTRAKHRRVLSGAWR